MPDKPLSMTLADQAALIGEPCNGPFRSNGPLLDALLRRSAWPKPSKLPNGKAHSRSWPLQLVPWGGLGVCSTISRSHWHRCRSHCPRLQKARRRFVGPRPPVLDVFGDNLDTLCKLWTAKEAAFKVFGSGLDFLTGLEWKAVRHSARATGHKPAVMLDISWQQLYRPNSLARRALNNEHP